MDFPVLYLRKGAERRLKAGHLWVYSNEVDTRRSPLTDFEAGSQAQLRASNDKPLGTVFVNPHALICGRLISRNATTGMTPKRLTDRLETALKLRGRVFPEPWYRWVYGDSDGLSGLVIDRFDDVVVVQISTAGMESMKEAIIRGVQRLVHPKAIILKNDGKMRSVEGLSSYVEQVEGEPVDVLHVRENGVRFEVPLSGGQKTGWFYDHRMNRGAGCWMCSAMLVAGACRPRLVVPAPLPVWTAHGRLWPRCTITLRSTGSIMWTPWRAMPSRCSRAWQMINRSSISSSWTRRH